MGNKTIMKEVMEFANGVSDENKMSFQISQNIIDFLEHFLGNISEKKLLKLRDIILKDGGRSVLVNSQMTMIVLQALNADIKYISNDEDGLSPINRVGGFIGGNMAFNLDVDNLPNVNF